MIGPFRGGRTRAAAGVPSQPNVFYIGQVNGGVWKSDDYGRTWNPIFDRPTHAVDRRHRRRALRSQHHLRRQRRRPAPSRSLGRQWHLQIHRRRQDLDTSRPARWPADSRARRRSARSQPSVRRRARPSLRPKRGARHLPLDRWRAELAEGAFERRKHRRLRRRDRSVESRRRLRLDVGSARRPVGRRQRIQRHRRRTLQIDRRRQHLASADQRPAQGSRRRSTSPSRPAIRAALYATAGDCIGKAGRLSLRRCRRDLVADHRRSASLAAASAAAICPSRKVDPKNPDIVYSRQHRDHALRPMAARPGSASAARPAATITRISGSIPTTATSFCWSAIRARSSP